MATLEQLESALRKADAAGNAADAKRFADAIRSMQSDAERGRASAEAIIERGLPGNPMTAFANRAVESIPVAGPAINEGLSMARGGISDVLQMLGIDAPSRGEMDSSIDLATRGEPGAA